jgi:hypothetical protein
VLSRALREAYREAAQLAAAAGQKEGQKGGQKGGQKQGQREGFCQPHPQLSAPAVGDGNKGGDSGAPLVRLGSLFQCLLAACGDSDEGKYVSVSLRSQFQS